MLGNTVLSAVHAGAQSNQDTAGGDKKCDRRQGVQGCRRDGRIHSDNDMQKGDRACQDERISKVLTTVPQGGDIFQRTSLLHQVARPTCFQDSLGCFL